jgi:hypothetical protein
VGARRDGKGGTGEGTRVGEGDRIKLLGRKPTASQGTIVNPLPSSAGTIVLGKISIDNQALQLIR